MTTCLNPGPDPGIFYKSEPGPRSRFLMTDRCKKNSVENKILVFDDLLQYIFILSPPELLRYSRRLASATLQNLKFLQFFMGLLNPIRNVNQGPVRIQ